MATRIYTETLTYSDEECIENFEDIEDDAQVLTNENIDIPDTTVDVTLPDVDYSFMSNDKVNLDDEYLFPLDPMEEESEDNNEMDVTTTASISTWSSVPLCQLAGCQPLRNIVHTKRQGFAMGVYPNSRKESFLLTFDSIIEDTVIYTNIQGRRIVRDIGLEWHNMDGIEIEAFIGLHLLSGTYYYMYTLFFCFT